MVVSHEVLQRGPEGCRVLIAAARRDVIEEAGGILSEAGIVPGRVDAAVLGWWRLLRDAGRVEEAGRQVILLLDETPQIVVVQDGLPIAFRSVGVGPGVAEEEFVGETAREVGYTLMSLELEHGSGAGVVAVWHRGEPPAALARSLETECGCSVATGSLDDLPLASEGLARRSAAAGEAVIDLTPPSWLAAAETRRFRRKLLGTAAAVFGVWVLAVGGLAGWLWAEERRLQRMRAVEARWSGPALEVREMRRRTQMIERYTDPTQSALECLREVSALLPRGIELTSFTYRKGESLRVAGEADSVNLIYAFKNGLDESALFLEAALQGPTFDRRRKKNIFDVELRLPGGDA
jgi:hypothetical protein